MLSSIIIDSDTDSDDDDRKHTAKPAAATDVSKQSTPDVVISWTIVMMNYTIKSPQQN
jgi:hypothetical protein